MAEQTGSTEHKQEQLPDFEKSLDQLENIIRGIEDGQVSLEQSIEQYEQGMGLIKHCRAILNRAETRIKKLTVDERGKVVESPDE